MEDSGNITFTCEGSGYPDVQLLMWQTGMGQTVPDAEYNVTSEQHEFSTTLSSTLTVDMDTCVQSKGYTCILSNGETQNIFFDCPPGV